MTHTQAVDGPRLLLAALCRGKAQLRNKNSWEADSAFIHIPSLKISYCLPLAEDGTPILGEALTQTLQRLMEEQTA